MTHFMWIQIGGPLYSRTASVFIIDFGVSWIRFGQCVVLYDLRGQEVWCVTSARRANTSYKC